MSEIADKLKDQLDGIGKQLNKIDAAGRGLIFKMSEEGSHQFEELAKEGETQLESGNTLGSQLKSIITVEGGAKEVLSTLKLAALGLFEKAKSEAQKTIEDLAQEVEQEEAPKADKPKAIKKAA